MNAMSWKKLTRRLQQDCCIICSGNVPDTAGSWDHFVPRAAGLSTRSPRLGLYFWAHGTCNSKRGHTLPTPVMVRRAMSIIDAMPDAERAAALQNIAAALAEHEAYVRTLGLLLLSAHKKTDLEDAA